jgi:hypothetical protein
MSNLRKYLVLVLAVVAMAVFGRLAWEMMLPPMSNAIASLPSLFSAVPTWVWWTVFGIGMSFLCPLKIALFGRSCRSARSCSPKRSSAYS